ncbi:MAG: hypothetical protein A4E57_04010 [Syntrophorhabdaceae bacterium PtaU1.Bin034]|jgi:hypothetical protein|nr:MAG: hypothetical protein A4E57_04010 [Syntrophorhabdaceae bacterium PtaU1.Bin034]
MSRNILTITRGLRPVLTYPACFLCILLFLMTIGVRCYAESPLPRMKPPAHDRMK